MVYTAAYIEATGRSHQEAIEKAKKSF